MLTKVRALLARATDSGATLEEQRTSAWVAADLIRKHGLSVSASTSPETVYIDRIVVRDRPAAQTSRRVIASKYAGRCQGCGARYSVGASIAWARDAGAVCLGCHRQARAA